LNIQQLGEQAGVDPSSISRIELHRTQATLTTAIRLCAVFGTSPHELLAYLRGTSHDAVLEPRAPQQASEAILRECDVQDVLLLFRHQQSAGRALFLHLLHAVARMDAQHAISRLPDLPPPDAPDPVSSLQPQGIPYPPLSEDLLLDLYLQGGVLLRRDAGAYLKARRRRLDLALAALQETLSMSDSALSRWERGVIGRLKLPDVLALDTTFARGGEVLGMFWRASAFHLGIETPPGTADTPWTADELHLAEWLIRLYRWATFFKGDAEWLAVLRDAPYLAGSSG
jgi:transcriptional regulator with XRE-family HTH domain